MTSLPRGVCSYIPNRNALCTGGRATAGVAAGNFGSSFWFSLIRKKILNVFVKHIRGEYES